MTDPIRAALERLIGLHNDDGAWGLHWDDAIADARAALLADGPAVPEGREPASVVGEPSDVEQLAQQVFEAMRFSGATSPAPPEWVFGGNSLMQDHARDVARAVLARFGHQPAPPAPVPVSERLPEPNRKVLAYYLNILGKGRTICAIWVPAKSRSDDLDSTVDDFQEYDEESDKYYWPEGWYEAIENWEDLGWVKVYEGEVVYWQPLPKWPALPLPAGEVE